MTPSRPPARMADLPAADPPAADPVAPRSAPRQERSRARQDSLIDAAEAIIGEAGADGLAMREVGRRAGLPIASVYHYFPSAASLVRAVSKRYVALIGGFARRRLAERVGEGAGEDIATLAAVMVDDVAGFLAGIPAAPAIWNALRSYPELRALDRADTLDTARAITPLLARVMPGEAEDRIEAQAIVILELVGANLVYALESDAPRRALLLAALRDTVAGIVRDLDRRR